MSNGQEPETAVLETAEDTDASFDAFSAGDEPTPTPEATQPQPEAQPSAEKPQWDKERQRADQAEANFRKAQAERESIAAKADAASKEVESLKARLDEFAKANDVNLDEIDTDITDAKVVKALKVMQSKLEAATQRAEKSEKAVSEMLTKEQVKQEEQRHEQVKQELIAEVEAEFPARFRNEALKAANKICEDRGFAPSDRYEAFKILRNCYKELASKSAAPTPKPVATDTGKTTITATPDTGEVKGGSLREVAAQLRKKAGL